MLEYDQYYFDTIDTDAKAYFLGLALADATIRKYWYRTKFMYDFGFNPNPIDRDIVERFAVETGGKVRLKKQYTNKREEPYVNALIEFKNKHMVETLIGHFGGDKKDFRVMYPDLPDNLKHHFVRGYYDGDGSLSISNNRWELALNGRELVLNQILADVGIRVNLTNDKSIKRARIRRVSDIEMFLKYIYSGIDKHEPLPLFLRRKYDLARRIID